MSIVAKKIIMGSGAVALPSDDEFNRVSFLSHFDGANNGVNNVFIDGHDTSSPHTITANGNVTQGSFGPFARPDGEWAVSFDGNDYLSVAETSADEFTFGTGNFTIEGWINNQTVAGDRTIITTAQGTDQQGVWFGIHQSKYYLIYNNSGNWSVIVHTGTPVANVWTHFAVVRNGTSNVVYINGSSIGSTTETARDLTNTNNLIAIGGRASVPQYTISTMSNVRVVKGTAVYTGNFTPSTSKLTAITNTKLLTCQSNRFVDNSASPLTITPAGNPAVSAFGPFLTSSVYDPAVNGTSAYFDGDSDSLTTGDSADFVLGDTFTLEAWVYPTAADVNAYPVIMSQAEGYPTGWYFSLRFTNEVNFYLNAADNAGGAIDLNTDDSDPVQLNAWNHIALSVSSGTGYIYVNGARKSSAATGINNNLDRSGTTFRVGIFNAAGSHDFNGYMCDARVVKGTALYSGTTYTIPTAPLTAITNTKLLLNMADAQAIDSAAQNNLTLYGTAKTSTAQKKFGTASLLLDGNSDYVSFADADSGSMFNFGATKWTIEGWFYQENDAGSGSNSHAIISRWDNQNSDKGFIFRITDSSGQKLQWLHTADGSTNVVYTDSRTISNDTWYHFALVKNDNLTLYLNGTGAVLNSSTFTIVSTTIPTLIGSLHESASPSQYFDGYIDDLRVSHMARYTSDFTAPSAAFADKGQ